MAGRSYEQTYYDLLERYAPRLVLLKLNKKGRNSGMAQTPSFVEELHEEILLARRESEKKGMYGTTCSMAYY